MYSVYMHTSPDGKKYVGITMQNPKDRWANGKGYANNKHFARAIKKYGWGNFRHEILYNNLTESQASDIEKRLIAELNLTDYSVGYNIREGGISGYHHSAKTREKMKRNHKDFSGENHPGYGTKRSAESKNKMSIAKKGKRIGFD